MRVSVLSAMARMGLDPWQEAGELACLSGKAATERMTSLIAALPDGSLTDVDLSAIPARLIALLPHQSRSNIPSHEALSGTGSTADFRAVILGYAIYIVLMFTAQWIVIGGLPSAQVDDAAAPAFSEVLPQKLPPPYSGQ